MTQTAIVVGGGIAGLFAGIALRKAGYEVTLFDLLKPPLRLAARGQLLSRIAVPRYG